MEKDLKDCEVKMDQNKDWLERKEGRNFGWTSRKVNAWQSIFILGTGVEFEIADSSNSLGTSKLLWSSLFQIMSDPDL